MSMSSDDQCFYEAKEARLASEEFALMHREEPAQSRDERNSHEGREGRKAIISSSVIVAARSRSESSVHRTRRRGGQQHRNRQGLPDVPAVPEIPARYLQVLATRDAGVCTHNNPAEHHRGPKTPAAAASAGERDHNTQSSSTTTACTCPPSSSSPASSPSSAFATCRSSRSTSSKIASALVGIRRRTVSHHPCPASPPSNHQRTSNLACSCPRSPALVMSRHTHPAAATNNTLHDREDDDYFLELAHHNPDHDLAALRRPMSRASFSSKRRSLPVDVVRPSTSGGNMSSRPPSRLDTLRASTGFFPSSDAQQRTSFTRASHYDDTASAAGRPRRFSAFADHTPVSPRQRVRSPEELSYGRRRDSFGTAPSEPRQHEGSIYLTPTLESQESPTESSDLPQTDSSVESQPADTVWDELDELKSRIKKLESGNKKTPSSAAASGDSSDRPRTATTAPTTINSSPKQPRKQDLPEPHHATPSPPVPEQNEQGGLWANVHPLLQDALGRSKDSLSSSVFHNLEAVVADALQLAALTGSSGSQSTPNVAINDRQVRRRVDNLCRNMTDLCISLRDTKPETPVLVASPAMIESPAADLPLRRFSRTTSLAVSSPNVDRPMSRLEQRKSSLLGPQALGGIMNLSPRGSHGELSASEAESTPTHSNSLQPPRRISAVPSRAMRSRMQQTREESRADEERAQRAEERVQRAPSRAMTEFSSSFRLTPRHASQERSPGAQRRNPSLRESLASRRKYETPPVLEEDASSPVPQPRNRVFSSGQHSQYNKVPSRTSSIIRSKHLME